MKGIKGYSKPAADGGVTVDVEGMCVDLVTVLKAGGFSKALWLEMAGSIWDNTNVEVTIPAQSKN